MPFDFFFEVMWPGEFHDVREKHFTLVASSVPNEKELMERADESRTSALSKDQPPEGDRAKKESAQGTSQP